MQFAHRYEFMVHARPARTPPSDRPRPLLTRPKRRPRSALRALRATRRPEAQLDIQQYLSLEFSVDDRR